MKLWFVLLENCCDFLQLLSYFILYFRPTHVSIEDFQIHFFIVNIPDWHVDHVQKLSILASVRVSLWSRFSLRSNPVSVHRCNLWVLLRPWTRLCKSLEGCIYQVHRSNWTLTRWGLWSFMLCLPSCLELGEAKVELGDTRWSQDVWYHKV